MKLSDLTATAPAEEAAPKRMRLSDLTAAAPSAKKRMRLSDLTTPAAEPKASKPSNMSDGLSRYDTKLDDDQESQFQSWKKTNAPDDSGADYDLRGAFKAGLSPSKNKHWPDTYKKPNHPTFSNESIYATGDDAKKAGHWEGDSFVGANAEKPINIKLPGADGVKKFIPDTKISASPEPTIFDKIKSFYPADLTKENMIDELSKDFDLPRKDVELNFDDIARKKAISTGVATQPTNEEFLNGVMTAAIPFSASIVGPLKVLKGVAGFMAVKEGSERAALPAAKAIWQGLNQEPVKYEVTKFRELFPDVGPTRDIADLAEFVVYGAGAKGIGDVLKTPRVAGELAGLRYRILKTLGVKQETGLVPMSDQQIRDAFGESAWKYLSKEGLIKFRNERNAMAGEGTGEGQRGSRAGEGQPEVKIEVSPAEKAPIVKEVAPPGDAPPLVLGGEKIEIPIPKRQLEPKPVSSIKLSDLPKTNVTAGGEPEKKIRHYTLSENVESILEKGFDSGREPVHGVKGLEAGPAKKKFGQDVLYFTTDDGRWNNAQVYVGEGKGDISNKAYDYDSQKWVEEKNAYKKVNLAPVEASIKQGAKILTVDSVQKFDQIVNGTEGYDGYNGIETLVAHAKKNGYDILNIKKGSSSNWTRMSASGVAQTNKYGDKDLHDQLTGKGGNDDYFVLNREVIDIQGKKTKPAEKLKGGKVISVTNRTDGGFGTLPTVVTYIPAGITPEHTLKRNFGSPEMAEKWIKERGLERSKEKPAAANKKQIQFTPDDQEAISAVKQDIQDMEAKKRLPVENAQGEGITVVTGYVPKYLSNKGVTKAKDGALLDKALKNEPLTEKQHERVNELVVMWYEETEKRYGKSIEDLKAEVSEPQAAEAIRSANQDEPITKSEEDLPEGATDFPFGESNQAQSKDLLGQAKLPEGGLKAKAKQAENPLTELKQAQNGEKQPELFGGRASSGASASTSSGKLGGFEQTPSQDKTPLKLAEETVKIYKAVNESLGSKATLRQGNVSPNLGLTYHPTENISTVGLNAVSVNAHELAHRVDGAQGLVEKVRSNTGRGDATRKALTDVYVKFYPGGKKNHPLRKRLTEGYATLVQKYLEQPTLIEAEYPALVRDFLKPGGLYYTKATGVLLEGFRSLIDRYQALDPLEKIGARVTEGQSGDVQKTYFSLKDKFDTAATNAFFPLEKVGGEAKLSGTADDPSLWAKMSRESKAIILTNINSDNGFWTLGPDGNFVKVSKDNLKTMVEKAEKDGVSAKVGWYLVARREVALLDENVSLEKIIAEATADLKLLLEEADPEAMEEIASLQKVLKDAKERLAKNKSIFHKDGFTEEEVRQAVDLYKKDFETHPVTLLHDQFNNENVKLLGHPLVMILKPDAAAKMLSQKGYASFKREVYDELEGEQVIPATLQVGKTKVSSMLSRVGSEKPILNPLYSAIINHSEIVKKALKQIVYNKIVKIAKSGQFPELFQVEPLKISIDARTRVITYPQEKDTAIIMAREKYKRIPIRLDSYLKTAIDDMLSFQNFGLFEKIFTLPSKVFTISTTGMFIPFTIVNYVRDQITAVAQTKSNYVPVIDSIRMLIGKMQNVNSPESKFMAEYFALGGEKNTLISIFDLSPEDALKVINGEKKGLERVGAFFEKIGSILSAPANISETSTRLTEYVRLRMEGKSQVAALDQAARITVPFKYKGSSKSFGLILRSIPYFSSSIQALRQAGRSGFGSKKEAARWWAVYAAVTTAIVASAYNTIHNSSDEQKNQYKDLSPEELAMNMYWPARGGKGLHKIPINQEMGGMGAIISMALAEMTGADYKAGDYVSAGVAFLPRQLQPAEWQQMVMAWIPQIIKPGIGMATNTRDFPSIRPIEGTSQQWKEPRLRFTEGTSGLAKWIGDKTGWSPIMIDYFMQGYAGRGATGWLNPMERMTIRPIQADKYYFEGGRRIQNFYNQKKQNDQQFSSFKGSPESYTDEQAEKILDKKAELEEINKLMKAYRTTKKDGDDTEDLRAMIIALIDKI